MTSVYRARCAAFGLSALAACLVACGVNPVTGRSEIQFVSEAEELQIGQKQYAPTRQAEGGDLAVMPELTAYVREVGQRLAAVADRQLPYEFTVINSSVPNAWALPGGKIAVNRGLLVELHDEAELAAVLGHEIVHAAARHGAKSQERGTLLQAGLAMAQAAAAVADVDRQVAGAVLGGAGVGSQLIQQRYGRDQELESDEYGMKYMQRAGYDPAAAVSLQETFVRLSAGKDPGWLEGLFASHPPSPERVERNQQTAARLGAGGERGAERYATRTAALRKLKPAYDKLDQAQLALNRKDLAAARRLAADAAKLAPQEARIAQLQGDIELGDRKPREALPFYTRALALDDGYYGAHLGAGLTQYRLGNRAQAEAQLRQSLKLYPTAPAALYLGHSARDRGDAREAMGWYRAVAGTQGPLAQEAAAAASRLQETLTVP